MIVECNQEKVQKKEKKSSTDTIDSFFGSNDFNNKSHNKDTNRNYKQTEQLIDKLLDKKSSKNSEDESLRPTVDIFEKFENKKEKSFVENTSIEKIEKDQSWNPDNKLDEKEEIFEIDQPNNTIPEKERTGNCEKYQENQKTDHFQNLDKPSLKKETKKKKSISFHLPKLNLKIGKTKDKDNKDIKHKFSNSETKEKDEEQFVESFNEFQINEEITQEITPSENSNVDKKDRELQNRKPDKKKKNAILKSSKDSFHFFKKSERKKEPIKSEKEHSDENSNDEFKEKQLQHQMITSDGPIDKDVVELLKITDDLLGKLPEDVIEEFSQSDDFTLYEKVMKKYEILK